jgi:protein TonB
VPRTNYSLSFVLALIFHGIALIFIGVAVTFNKPEASESPIHPDSVTLSLVEELLTETPSPKNADTAPRPEQDNKLEFLRLPNPLLQAPSYVDVSSDTVEIPKHPLPDFSPPPVTMMINPPTELPDKLVMPKLATILASQETTDPYSSHSDSTGGMLQGVLVPPTTKDQSVRPKYPMASRRRGEEGRVILDVMVSQEGKPKSVALVASSGHKELDRAAEEAVSTTLFIPGERNGKTVEASARIVILFQLKPN